MMDIDIQRLKTDAAYWDDVAPEYATGAFVFELFTGEYVVVFGEGRVIVKHPENMASLYKIKESLTRPQCLDNYSDSGLPSEGSDCEYYTASGNWRPAKCIARGHDHNDDVAVIQTANRMFIVSESERQKLRLPERQRQRDELISEIKTDLDALNVEHPKNLAMGLAIGMINRGWKKVTE